MPECGYLTTPILNSQKAGCGRKKLNEQDENNNLTSADSRKIDN